MSQTGLVVIGDIVNSRSIRNRAGVQRQLKKHFEHRNDRRSSELILPYTITLGDEFHAVYQSGGNTVRDILQTAAVLAPHRARFVLSAGCMDVEADIENRVGAGVNVPAYQQAREQIGVLKEQDRRIAFISPDCDSATVRALDGELQAFDELLRQGTKTRLMNLAAGRVAENQQDEVEDGVVKQTKTKSHEVLETIGRTTARLKKILS